MTLKIILDKYYGYRPADWKECKFLEYNGPAGNFCFHPNRINQCLEKECPLPIEVKE